MINLIFMLSLTFTLCSNTQYANIVSQFLELNNELGNPREDVGVIISNVKSSINDEEKQVDAHYKELSNYCTTADASIAAAIIKLSNDINDSTKNLHDWKASLGTSLKDVSKAENDIKSTLTKIQNNQRAIEKAAEDFKVTITETNQKLSVVKVLRDIITDELLNHAHGHSFLQLNKFTDKLNELKGMLNSDSDSLYSPLVSVLLELASEQNFSDPSILKKILQNINNLEKSLKDFSAQRKATLDNEIKTLRSNAANLFKIKNAYENMKAQSISKRIDAQHYIHFYTNEIAHFKAEKGRKTAEKSLLHKLCVFEDRAHSEDKKDISKFKAKVIPYIVEQIQKLQ